MVVFLEPICRGLFGVCYLDGAEFKCYLRKEDENLRIEKPFHDTSFEISDFLEE